MTFLSNIQSVAKYESKLLIRSWFFRVFTVLAIGITTLLIFSYLYRRILTDFGLLCPFRRIYLI